MAQTTPYNPVLPQEVQETINIASQKVQVLKEEEISLSKRKVELEREIARMEITRDTVSSEIPKLEETYRVASLNVETAKSSLQLIKDDLTSINDLLRSAKKELETVKIGREQEEKRMQDTVAVIRAKEDELKKKEQQLEVDIAAFVQRKKTVVELIASI